MRIAGIDPDTKSITIVIFDDAEAGEPEICRIEAKGRRAEDRIEGLWLSANSTTAFDPSWRPTPDWTYLERPMVVHNAKAAIDQSVIVGMIRAMLWSRNASHSLVDPGTWKKGLLGNGHASKEEIAAYAQNVLGIAPGHTQDTFDAACIAAWGMNNLPKLGAKTQ